MENKVQLLKVEDVSKLLQIPIGSLYHMVNQKKIPYIKIGKLVRFDPVEIERWKLTKSVKVGV